MNEKEFALTTFNQSRIFLGLFLTPIVFIGLVFLGAEINSLFVPVSSIVIYLFTYYHFVVGYLTAVVTEEEIHFTWTEKLFFNFKSIQPVKISDIKAVIIDNGELLRKIKTSNRTIQISTARIQQKDAAKFIRELKSISKRNGGKIIDSWDEWNDKGYLKAAYRINTGILIIAIIAVIFAIAKKGFDAKMLFIALLLIPQMFLYGIQMKRKLK